MDTSTYISRDEYVDKVRPYIGKQIIKVFVGQRRGKLWNKEVDFVADKGEERIYVQVTYLLSNDDTIEREFGNLKAIDNNHPKYVVTMDDYPCGQDYPGIRQMHLLDFLMADKL